MRTAVMMGTGVLTAAAVAAGYFGVADEIATGFKILAAVSGAAAVAGMLFGGVRVADARPDRRRLPARIRAVI